MATPITTAEPTDTLTLKTEEQTNPRVVMEAVRERIKVLCKEGGLDYEEVRKEILAASEETRDNISYDSKWACGSWGQEDTNSGHVGKSECKSTKLQLACSVGWIVQTIAYRNQFQQYRYKQQLVEMALTMSVASMVSTHSKSLLEGYEGRVSIHQDEDHEKWETEGRQCDCEDGDDCYCDDGHYRPATPEELHKDLVEKFYNFLNSYYSIDRLTPDTTMVSYENIVISFNDLTAHEPVKRAFRAANDIVQEVFA